MTLQLARKQRFSNMPDDDPLEALAKLRSALDQQLDELYRFALKLRRDVNLVAGELAGFSGFAVSALVTHTFTTVGTDETVTHTLGVVPTHMLQLRPVGTTNAGDVYFGSILPTSTDVTFRVTQLGAQAVILFA